jgi:hypothetical protein
MTSAFGGNTGKLMAGQALSVFLSGLSDQESSCHYWCRSPVGWTSANYVHRVLPALDDIYRYNFRALF